MDRKYFKQYATDEINIDEVPFAMLVDDEYVEIKEVKRDKENFEVEVRMINQNNKLNFKIENKLFNGPEKLNLNLCSIIKENFEDYFLEMSDKTSLSIGMLFGIAIMTAFFSGILSFFLQKTFINLYIILLIVNIVLYVSYYLIRGRKQSINSTMYDYLIFFILIKINDMYYCKNTCGKKRGEFFGGIE